MFGKFLISSKPGHTIHTHLVRARLGVAPREHARDAHGRHAAITRHAVGEAQRRRATRRQLPVQPVELAHSRRHLPGKRHSQYSRTMAPVFVVHEEPHKTGSVMIHALCTSKDTSTKQGLGNVKVPLLSSVAAPSPVTSTHHGGVLQVEDALPDLSASLSRVPALLGRQRHERRRRHRFLVSWVTK